MPLCFLYLVPYLYCFFPPTLTSRDILCSWPDMNIGDYSPCSFGCLFLGTGSFLIDTVWLVLRRRLVRTFLRPSELSHFVAPLSWFSAPWTWDGMASLDYNLYFFNPRRLLGHTWVSFHTVGPRNSLQAVRAVSWETDKAFLIYLPALG